jgi:hypothetical protein
LSEIFLTGSGDTVTVRSALSAPPTLMSRGVTDLVTMGFNVHSWSWGFVGPMFAQVGARAMRISTGPQATIDSAIAAGMTVMINLSATDLAGAQACAAANAKYGSKVIFECGNEPNATPPAQYATQLTAFATAVRAGYPAAIITAPQTNGSFWAATQTWLKTFEAVPGVFDQFSVGNFHPYYMTPENSWKYELDRVPATMATVSGKSMEFVLGEVGWSNAVGVLPNQTAENVNSTNNNIQPMEIAADYYSRYIPLARATRMVRSVAFYSLVDEGAADPAFMNQEAHFGIFVNATTPKPAMSVCKDLFAYVHAASEAATYNRGSDWFVKLKIGGSYALIAWTVGTIRAVPIAVSGGPVSWNVAGSSTKTVLNGTLINVPLGRRSVVISSSAPIDFPEFK